MKKGTCFLTAFIFSLLITSSYAGVGEGISEKGTLNSCQYILKRLVNNTFDYFQIEKNNWSFWNWEECMWPESWWQQFYYGPPEYPISWLGLINSWDFPDWPLFVDTFGENYCYWNPPPGLVIYNPVAFFLWGVNNGSWNGSCYGLAMGAILAFSAENAFKERFPAVGNFLNLYSVQLNDEVRKVPNLLHTIQWNGQTQEFIDDNYRKSTNQTLVELKNYLSYPYQSTPDKILCLDNQNGPGQHAVVPYLIKEGTTIDTIFINDVNDNFNDDWILIDKTNSNYTWSYQWGETDWGGSKGLYLSESLTSYLTNIPNPENKNGKRNTIVSIYSEQDDHIKITNSNNSNEFIEFNPNDMTLLNTFEFGRPVYNFSEYYPSPVGYRLLDGNYQIEFSCLWDSSANIGVMRDNFLYNYKRNNFGTTETDIIKLRGDTLIVQNDDPTDKNINIQITSEQLDNSKTYKLSNTTLNQNDILTSLINASQELIVSNSGVEKTYDLEIAFQNSEKEDLFLNQLIPLPLNTSHKVVPNWDSLSTKTVEILVDIGNNGTVDDTLFLDNHILNYLITNGWNLLSLPFIVPDSSVTSLFSFAVSPAYSYGTSGYVQNNFMSPGVGYWLKFGIAQNVEVIGNPVASDTIPVHQYWNLIGSISKPLTVTDLISIPPNIIISPFYGYGSTGYSQSTILSPGKGYWVKCNAPGILILPSESSSLKKTIQNDSNVISHTASIQISDITGASQKLLITSNEIENLEYYELPPLPPTGIFDVRFSTGRMLETIKEGEQREIPILISSAKYPLTISWEMTDKRITATLRAGNEGYSMIGSTTITLTNPVDKIFLLVGSEFTTPEKFALQQNYPNPFNSSTIIKYSIANETQVNLSVYNVLGEKVADLQDEVMKPGQYEVEFNSSTLASGIYLYKLKAGNFTEIKKMVLLK